MKMMNRALIGLLAVLLAVFLTACASRGEQAAATVIPTTAVPPTAVPPTAVPPTSEDDAPGPGWVLALESDANYDGIADKIYYIPAGAPADGVSFEDPRRADVAVAASDIALVQRSASGREVILSIDVHGGRADQPLFDFAGRREPAGYLLALDPARGPLINLLPYGAGGAGYGGIIGINWTPGENGFRVVAEMP